MTEEFRYLTEEESKRMVVVGAEVRFTPLIADPGEFTISLPHEANGLEDLGRRYATRVPLDADRESVENGLRAAAQAMVNHVMKWFDETVNANVKKG